MNEDFTILASAYLDGAATPEERAQVTSSPDLLAEVERQRLVRALLADVETSSISLREQHLAAALGAWDRLPDAERTGAARDITPQGIDPATAAAASTISTPPPTSLEGRRRSKTARWMGAAAAALALVLAGGVVLQSISSDDDDDSISSAAVDSSDDAPEPNSSAAIADEAADELQRDLQSSAGASQEVVEKTADAPTALDEDSLGIDIDAEAPPKEADLEVLSTPEQLGIFASDAVGAPNSPDIPASTDASAETATQADGLSEDEEVIQAFEFPLCGGADYVVGPAEYRGEAVVVGVNESRGLAIAYRALDCSVIARAALP
jgi:hypothetical protein